MHMLYSSPDSLVGKFSCRKPSFKRGFTLSYGAGTKLLYYSTS